LVHHATEFAPRGAFFIVKNEHLVGWRVFGKEKGVVEEKKVREVFLPVSAESVLSEAIKSLTTVTAQNGGQTDDAEVLQKLEFGAPDKMVSIPLVARGRGVAVLYADYGNEGGEVNVEGLEALVRVAGLTVEVLASAKTVVKKPTGKKSDFAEEDLAPEKFAETPTVVSTVVETAPSFVSQPMIEPAFESTSFTSPATAVEEVEETTIENESYSEFEMASSAYQSEFETASVQTQAEFERVETEPQAEFETAPETEVEEYPAFDTGSWSSTTETSTGFSAQEFAQNFAKETDPVEYAKDFSYQVEKDYSYPSETETTTAPTQDYEFETAGSYQEIQTETVPPLEEFVPTKEQTYGSFEPENSQVETVEISQPISTPPAKSRLSERNVDLPIEVTEDERRLHNDARRFARLLVSEIKLYNEQKVKEGRESSDLYERLKEAIDRSREMYDKRVQPPVAAKFDYFHYELVNTLAEGDDNKLGSGYPGSTV
jgi:hypothetical protein